MEATAAPAATTEVAAKGNFVQMYTHEKQDIKRL